MESYVQQKNSRPPGPYKTERQYGQQKSWHGKLC